MPSTIVPIMLHRMLPPSRIAHAATGKEGIKDSSRKMNPIAIKLNPMVVFLFIDHISFLKQYNKI